VSPLDPLDDMAIGFFGHPEAPDEPPKERGRLLHVIHVTHMPITSS